MRILLWSPLRARWTPITPVRAAFPVRTSDRSPRPWDGTERRRMPRQEA